MPSNRLSDTEHLSLALTERRDLALAHLRRQMDARGMTEREGWKIVESVRNGATGTELTLRPIHLRKDPPSELECVIRVPCDGTMPGEPRAR